LVGKLVALTIIINAAVGIGLILVVAGVGLPSGTTSAAPTFNGAFQKFDVFYPPQAPNSFVFGTANQIQIDLNLTSSVAEFTAGAPAKVSAAGSVSYTLNEQIKNVTITFVGANPFETQPNQGIMAGGPPAISGVVLYPTPDSQCLVKPSNRLDTLLCGNSNDIVWPSAISSHPFITINLNNGSAPLIEDDLASSDVVTVATSTIISNPTNQYSQNVQTYTAVAVVVLMLGDGVVAIFTLNSKKKKGRGPIRRPQNRD
jgi:hypothetical protein